MSNLVTVTLVHSSSSEVQGSQQKLSVRFVGCDSVLICTQVLAREGIMLHWRRGWCFPVLVPKSLPLLPAQLAPSCLTQRWGWCSVVLVVALANGPRRVEAPCSGGWHHPLSVGAAGCTASAPCFPLGWTRTWWSPPWLQMELGFSTLARPTSV